MCTILHVNYMLQLCKAVYSSLLCTWIAFFMQIRCTVHCHFLHSSIGRCTAITVLDTITVVKRYALTIRVSFHEGQIHLLMIPFISRLALKKTISLFLLFICTQHRYFEIRTLVLVSRNGSRHLYSPLRCFHVRR